MLICSLYGSIYFFGVSFALPTPTLGLCASTPTSSVEVSHLRQVGRIYNLAREGVTLRTGRGD